MRIRSFFWLILVGSCIGVLIFALTVHPEFLAVMHITLSRSHPSEDTVTILTLHLTDVQGVPPIEQAQVISRMTMTNMDMSTVTSTLQPLEHGYYQTALRWSMTGQWAIDVIAHAEGFLSTNQTVFIDVV
jgi:hypothetical protein